MTVTTPTRHVILGNGPAGVVAAEQIRKQRPRDSIVMVGAEPEPPYSRMAIPYLLIGKVGEKGTYLRKDPDHFKKQNIQEIRARATKLDTAGILFFLGILMSIGVLDKSGLLKELAVFLSNNLPSLDIIATVIGLASALIDNVPLVAATMGMYDLSEFGTDDRLWQLIALCAGTGGSILVIGSASGVALMGLEKVDFLWYAKRVSIGATIGYFAGIATYLAQTAILSGGFVGNLLAETPAIVDMVQSAGVL